MVRIIPDRASEDEANEEQVRCGHESREHSFLMVSGGLQETERTGRKEAGVSQAPALQPTDWNWTVGDNSFPDLGLSFPTCAWGEGQKMVSYKNVKNALATLTFWGPVLTKDSQSAF